MGSSAAVCRMPPKSQRRDAATTASGRGEGGAAQQPCRRARAARQFRAARSRMASAARDLAPDWPKAHLRSRAPRTSYLIYGLYADTSSAVLPTVVIDKQSKSTGSSLANDMLRSYLRVQLPTCTAARRDARLVHVWHVDTCLIACHAAPFVLAWVEARGLTVVRGMHSQPDRQDLMFA